MNSDELPPGTIDSLLKLVSQQVDHAPLVLLTARRSGYARPEVAGRSDGVAPEHIRLAEQVLADWLVQRPDRDREGLLTGVRLMPVFEDTEHAAALVILGRADDWPAEGRHWLDEACGWLRGLLIARWGQGSSGGQPARPEAMLALAQTVAENPSPQAVIESLKTHLLSHHISNASYLVFRPPENAGNRSASRYAEIVGAWSRRRGSGGGLGVRLQIRDYAEGLRRLAHRRVIAIDEIDEGVLSLFDPLVRGFLRGDDICSAAFFMLQAGGARLGLIILTADQPGHFNGPELTACQAAVELIALGAQAQMLTAEHERVSQLRSAMLDGVSDGIMLVAPHFNGSLVLSTNQMFAELFEIASASVDGRPLVDLLARLSLPEDVRANLRRAWLHTPLHTADQQRGSFRFVQSTGRMTEVEWTSTPVVQAGRALGRLFAFHDATADRASERMRAEFLSRISHELRTPLMSIQGSAEFIYEAPDETRARIAGEYSRIILDSAHHLKTIINDLIDLTRADAGQIALVRQPVHVGEVLRDISARLEPLARGRHQQLAVICENEDCRASIDRTRITQVLTNVVSNAIKYAPEGGAILVTLRLALALADLPRGAPGDVVLPAVVIQVQDTGRGLAPGDVEQVFTPFFRTEAARRDRVEGVGLGLAIARSLVELHQGKIWAIPAPPAEGGCFVIVLPALRE